MGRTRVALLQATAECVEKYGVRRTTMVDVAARSGVAKATLYNHFRTKEDLLVALVESLVADTVAACLQTAATDGPAAALAQAAVAVSGSGALRKAAAEEPALLAPLLLPDAGRGWQAVRDGVDAALATGRAELAADGADLVLRWLVSHVAWPTTREQAELGAVHLVQALGRPSAASPAVVGPAPAAPVRPVGQAGSPGVDRSGLGWPG